MCMFTWRVLSGEGNGRKVRIGDWGLGIRYGVHTLFLIQRGGCLLNNTI